MQVLIVECDELTTSSDTKINIKVQKEVPYGGRFSWVQIIVEMPADVPEEILLFFILALCGGRM